MDDVIRRWLDCEYDFFYRNQARNMPNSLIGAFSILDIIDCSLTLLIDYCYEHELHISESDVIGATVGDGDYSGKTFEVDMDDGVGLLFSVSKYKDKFIHIDLDGWAKGKQGRRMRMHSESLSNDILNVEVVQYRIREILKKAVDHVIGDANMEAYFILQGINVRNYDI